MSLPDLSYLSPAQQAAFLEGPALPPPPGVIPDFDNPSNGNRFSVGIEISCIVVTSVFFTVRLYVSWFVFKKLFLNDVFLILAYGLSIGYYGLVLDSINQVGYLIHQWDVRYKDLFYMIRSFIITPTLYGLSIMFIKTAIVLEWLRIFNPRGTRGFFYWGSCAVLLVNFLFYGSTAFTFNLACRPFERYWNPFIQGTCYYDVFKLDLPAGVINFVVDLMIFLLPHKVIWQLQLSLKKKLGVAAIFAVGLFAIASACCRVIWTVWLLRSDDIIYRVTALGLWVSAEMTCGIIVFCVPSVPKAVASLNSFKIWNSFKSWPRFSESTPKDFNTDPSLSNNSQNSYQKLDGQSSLPLQKLGPVTLTKPCSLTAHKSRSGLDNSSILRTTHVTSRSHDDIDRVTAEDQFNRQHPWAVATDELQEH
ncbi:hypothetical protein F5B20DRAFT_192027 [Whalleya microplaca]|nr:hypothetical protein F5B20DRAFT_192027 [Whalleya microplaca]